MNFSSLIPGHTVDALSCTLSVGIARDITLLFAKHLLFQKQTSSFHKSYF